MSVRPAVVLLILALVSVAGAAERAVLRARAPALSPDGSRLAFAYRGDIWVVGREGGLARRLTTHPAYDSGPGWSPDGSRIAFSSIRHGRYDVFVVDATGGVPTRVTQHSGHDLLEDWVDDGTLLIRTTRAGSSDLALVPLDGSTPRRLTRTPFDSELYASVVPGGDAILLSDKSAGRYRRTKFHGSAASDVWVLRLRGAGPRWQRLVDSEFNDHSPGLAKDGRVWFVSNRSGTPNLWSVPFAGGDPRRETSFEGRGVRRVSLSRDGRWAAFDRADRIHVLRLPDGGGAAAPKPVDIRVAIDAERNPVEHRTVTSGVDEFEISPDGKLMAFVVRGEIFVAPVDDGGLARNVTNTVARETQVAWGDGSRSLVFVSDRDGNREVYRVDLLDDELERLTETPEGEAWPTPSPDGRHLAWIAGSETIRIEPVEKGERRRAVRKRARELAELSRVPLPEGLEADAQRLATLAAAIAEGTEPPADVEKAGVPFLVRAMGKLDPDAPEGRRRMLRLSAALRETTGYPMADPDVEKDDADRFRQVAFHWATYWKDRSGAEQKIRFEAPEGFEAPTFPERTVREPVVVKGAFADLGLWSIRPFDWSPDSRWLAYPQREPGYRTDVWALDVRDGSVDRVTSHPSARHPRFARDGKWLSFVSSAADDDDIYVTRLAAPERTFPDDPIREVLEGSGEDAKKGKKEDGPPEIVIDFTRIVDRAAQATTYPTNEGDPILSPDGKTVLFTAAMGDSTELWSIPAPHVEGARTPRQLTRGERPAGIRLSPDGKRVFYLSSGRVRSIGIGGGSSKAHGVRAELRVDRAAELSYALDETLWLLGTWFYDPDLHGADWEEVSKRYRDLLDDTAPGLDFEMLLDDLCAELDASHLGASGASHGGESEPETGELGIELAPARLAEGRHVVESVLPDGPADHEDGKLVPGEEIVAVNGTRLGKGVNLWTLLRGTIGRRVELRVRPAEGEVRSVLVKPTAYRTVRTLLYERWIRERRAMVDEWSKGKLAYLHIRSMNGTSLTRFRREIAVLCAGKEGALIDVRYNGGGWTAVHLLDMLARRPYVMRAFRRGTRISENRYRDHGLEIPMAALTNHASFSNAEIFSEGFRRLGLGPVVGIPTAGGVIGTGSWRLLNGMSLRRPSWSAWTVDGENLEGNGRPVTHRVENGPGREGHAEDRQLRKAVEVMLERR